MPAFFRMLLYAWSLVLDVAPDLLLGEVKHASENDEERITRKPISCGLPGAAQRPTS
jgi:hypothetical protein